MDIPDFARYLTQRHWLFRDHSAYTIGIHYLLSTLEITMKSTSQNMFLFTLFMLSTFFTSAEEQAFTAPPAINNFGQHFFVEDGLNLPKESKFKIAFDVAKQGDIDAVNRQFNSLARFINMHVTHGLSADNIQLALVVHGKAGFDLLTDEHYAKYQASEGNTVNANPNSPLLAELLKNNVNIYLCGQSAAHYGIETAHLHSGVTMALSAMTANALLQQEGYTLNPF